MLYLYINIVYNGLIKTNKITINILLHIIRTCSIKIYNILKNIITFFENTIFFNFHTWLLCKRVFFKTKIYIKFLFKNNEIICNKLIKYKTNYNVFLNKNNLMQFTI